MHCFLRSVCPNTYNFYANNIMVWVFAGETHGVQVCLLPCTKVQGAIVVTLVLLWVWHGSGCHILKVLQQSCLFFACGGQPATLYVDSLFCVYPFSYSY